MNDISVTIQEKDILIMTKKPKYQEIYDYYQKAITNHKLKVGEVTNMYVIAEKMTQADLIVKP